MNSLNLKKKNIESKNIEKKWKSNKTFKGWLKPERDIPFKAKCILCNVSIVFELSCIKNIITVPII